MSGTIACPRCGVPVAPEQDWCLECGHAARTRVAGPPRWRIPVAIAVSVAALALAALAVAFVDLTKDPEEVPPPATAPAATAAPPATTAPPAAPEPTATAPAAPPPPTQP